MLAGLGDNLQVKFLWGKKEGMAIYRKILRGMMCSHAARGDASPWQVELID